MFDFFSIYLYFSSKKLNNSYVNLRTSKYEKYKQYFYLIIVVLKI